MYRKKNLGGGHDIKRVRIKISHPLLLHRQLLSTLVTRLQGLALSPMTKRSNSSNKKYPSPTWLRTVGS